MVTETEIGPFVPKTRNRGLTLAPMLLEVPKLLSNNALSRNRVYNCRSCWHYNEYYHLCDEMDALIPFNRALCRRIHYLECVHYRLNWPKKGCRKSHDRQFGMSMSHNPRSMISYPKTAEQGQTVSCDGTPG